MSSIAVKVDSRSSAVALLAAAVAFGVGLVVGYAPLGMPYLLIAALLVGALAFLRTELAIHLLILSMLLSPEFTVGGAVGTGSLDASRAAVIRVEDLLLIVIGVAWLAKIAVHKQLGLVLRTPLNLPIALYALAIVASTLVGIGSGRVQPLTGSLYAGKYLEYFVIYFLVVNHARDRRALQRMLVTAIITAVLVAIVAALQIPGGERVSAPFEGERGEPNTLGGYLVLMMSILGGLALEAGSRRARIGLVLLVSLLAVPFMYTLSRSSWLAAAGAALVLFAVTREKKRLLAFLAVAAVLAVLFLPSEVTERTAYTFQEQRGSMRVGDLTLDPSSSARLRSWGDTVRDAARHPLLGHGVTGYYFLDAQYFRILAETGILGLAAFAFLIYLLGRYARTASRSLSDPLLRGMTAGFLAALGGLLVHALGANTFIIVRIMEPFWLFAGLVMVAPFLDEPDSTDPAPLRGKAAETKGLGHGAA
jgi:hypothetical protein